MLGALEYFLPLTENYNKELAKKLSLTNFTQENLQDGLMILMRQTDRNVQTANFYAYLKNTIVLNGEVVNAREYLRSLPEYQNKYAGSPAQRREFEAEFEADLKNLLEEKGVLKLGYVENNKFVIPGVDRNSQSVVELRRKVQMISKNSLGNVTDDDLRTINMQIYGKSFMVFKNWIPRLVDVRIGNMKYNAATDAYEWGRMRTVFRIIGDDLLHSIDNLYGAIAGTEKGVDYMVSLYEKKRSDYEEDTGKELKMTETEFIDLVRANVKNQLLDTIFLTTMFILVAGLKAGMPDDDDKKEDEAVLNQYRFITRAADKFKNELSYFYDPTSLTNLVSKGIFPSLSLLDNFKKGIVNFLRENWALATGDEEGAEDIKVIKYWMKMFPFTNQMIGYLPMYYPELAKDLGIRVQSNYGLTK
jgi:hypothetical protein